MAKNKAPNHLASDNIDFLLSNYPNKSRFAEAFRTLRTNIQFSFMKKNFRSLLITSTAEKEGKTTTVANLAYTMAQAGKSVLMIDADLRRPTLSRIIASKKSQGLTGVLTGVFGADITNGDLGRYTPGDLLKLIAFQSKTGILHLNGKNDKIDLLFLKGQPTDINWVTRPEDKKLGRILIKSGFLNIKQVKEAIIRQKSTGQKLGFILINMGLMKEDDLKGHLTIQMMEGLRSALMLKTGKFHFENLLESDFEQSFLYPVDFQKLYRQAITDEEELAFLREKIYSAIVKTGTDNLFLLPSGILPPNPSELLGSDRMSFLMSVLRKKFDRLIIDSPPILPASDALLLTPFTDGTVFVIKAGQVNRALIKKAVEQLQLAHANIIGVALNHVDIKKEGYYKYYHKYYSKYYG